MKTAIKHWFLGVIAALAVLFGWLAWAQSDLGWELPTENTDGSVYDDPGGVRVYHSTLSGGPYTAVADLAPDAVTYTHTETVEGLNCYVVTAYDASGNESDFSNEGCKVIDTIAPNPPVLTVN